MSRLIGHAFYSTALRFRNATDGAAFSFSTTFAFAIVPEYPPSPSLRPLPSRLPDLSPCPFSPSRPLAVPLVLLSTFARPLALAALSPLAAPPLSPSAPDFTGDVKRDERTLMAVRMFGGREELRWREASGKWNGRWVLNGSIGKA